MGKTIKKITRLEDVFEYISKSEVPAFKYSKTPKPIVLAGVERIMKCPNGACVKVENVTTRATGAGYCNFMGLCGSIRTELKKRGFNRMVSRQYVKDTDSCYFHVRPSK